MTFAFGLATLGAVMIVILRNYATATVRQERAVLDRISLDSAAALVLGRMEPQTDQPIAPHLAPSVVLNGRTIVVEVSLPEGKADLAMDEAGALASGLEKRGLPTGLPELAGNERLGLADLARLTGLTMRAEDCLRRRYTLGRAPEGFEPLASAGSQTRLSRQIMVGDQVDLRSSFSREGRHEVLWQRARFTGMGPRWLIHDDRLLHLKSTHACR
jgi:hypothetical protein